MIFSTLHDRNLTVLVVSFFLMASTLVAQRNQRTQRIGYIDMEYILENVPEYKQAQKTLDSKILKWRSELDKISREIEKLKTDLANEREILTASLIADKEDEIEIKQKELRTKEEEYFGASGSMFLYRKQIIFPVQDLVYNAIQDIAKRQKYDFVLDKSSDLIMLYSNKKYDISELVLRSIGIKRKRNERDKIQAELNSKDGLSDEQKKKVLAREAAEKKKQADRLAQKKKIEDARTKRKAAIEAKRELLRKKKEEARKKREDKKKQEQSNN